MKKLKLKKTKTFQSDDFSDNSSDLEFAANHRNYNKLEKIPEPVMNKIHDNFLGRLEKSRKIRDINPLEIEEEHEESIQWTMLNQRYFFS